MRHGARFSAALAALALAMTLVVGVVASDHAHIGPARGGAIPAAGFEPLGPGARFTWAPAFKAESHPIGIAQQFEAHLRLAVPWDPQGYGLGVRRVVEAQHSVPGRLLRYTVSLPGWSDRPRPYVRLSVILPEN